MKKAKIIPGVILLIFFCTSLGEGTEFNLKLAGGLSFINPNEVNRVLKDWEQWQIRNTEAIKNWHYLGGGVSEITMAWDLEIEFQFSVTSRFSAGIASGYIYGDISKKNTAVTIERVLGVYDMGKPSKMTAIPIILSAYYFQPISHSLRAYIRGGGGWLWTNYVERESSKKDDVENYSYPKTIEASARDTMTLLALGLLFETEPGIRFFIEGSWRRAKVSGFDGNDKDGTAGTLFFLEEYDSDLDYWQEKYKIFPEMPSGENVRSVKEAEVDYGGFSIKMGIMIRF